MASAAAAAESSSEMLQAIDIEELEVTETDAALLRELLEEWEKEELEKDRVLKQIENESNANSGDDDRLEQTEELDVDGFDYYWPEMVEILRPGSPPVDETIAWYVDKEKFGTSSEFDSNIDYSQLYNGVFLGEEETTYYCLWQD